MFTEERLELARSTLLRQSSLDEFRCSNRHDVLEVDSDVDDVNGRMPALGCQS